MNNPLQSLVLALGVVLLVPAVAPGQIARETLAPTPATETTAATPAPSAPISTPVTPPSTRYQPTTQSVFSVPAKSRNPFWPIGFYPQPKRANVVVEDQLLRIPVEAFRVTMTFADPGGIAIINGKEYARGQFLTVPTATGEAKLLITAIEDGFVAVQYKALVERIPITRK